MKRWGRAQRALKASMLGGALLAAVSGPVWAEGDGLDLSANVALTTDYVFRGISQTLNDPAVQGGMDATYGMFYLGVWASNVDFGFGDPADVEIDYYAGITPTWKNLSFDLGAIYYNYPATPDGYDIWEGKFGVSTTMWDSLGLSFTTYVSDRDYTVFEFGTEYSFDKKIWIFTPSVSGLIGWYDSYGDFISDYTYWNAGLTLGFWDKPNFSLDVRYWDTDGGSGFCGNLCDERVVGTISASF